MDKSNGQMLQTYRSHVNTQYRIRSCLGFGDAVVISGSEDGKLYIWDVLEGRVLLTLLAHNGKVPSAVTCSSVRKEWASAGADGMTHISSMLRDLLLIRCRDCHNLGYTNVGMSRYIPAY